MGRAIALVPPMIVAMYMPFCTPAVAPTNSAAEAQKHMAELWREPENLARADLFNGPWGTDYAPDAKALYEKTKEKTHGNSPGMTVEDPEGVEWSVKQGPEGHTEVVLARVLSALGYHQPAIYYLPSFRLNHGSWVEVAPGGRFRRHDKILKEDGIWSWQQNPFVGTRPYQTLFVVLLMFNSSDLKNSNNSIYELKEPREGAAQWYVVRDLGMALGETGRMFPKRGDADLFRRVPFITGVKDGYVEFDYRGFHQELVHKRFTPADVAAACALLGQLSDQQWRDAFRAGGYNEAEAKPFIERIQQKIVEGRRLQNVS
jgi:hypothetical protein